MGMRYLALLVIVGLAACGSTKSAGPGDANARAACRKYYALTADAHNGVLTPASLKSASKSIYSDARYSTYKPVTQAAVAFAAAEAQGKNSAPQVAALDTACKPLKLG